MPLSAEQGAGQDSVTSSDSSGSGSGIVDHVVSNRTGSLLVTALVYTPVVLQFSHVSLSLSVWSVCFDQTHLMINIFKHPSKIRLHSSLDSFA